MHKEQDSRMPLCKSIAQLPWHCTVGLVLSAEAEGFGDELRNGSDSLVEKLESWDCFSLKWFEMVLSTGRSRRNSQHTSLLHSKEWMQ